MNKIHKCICEIKDQINDITSGLWEKTGSTLHPITLTDFVGINTDTAGHELDVNGSAYIRDDLMVGDDTPTKITLTGNDLFVQGQMEVLGTSGSYIYSLALGTYNPVGNNGYLVTNSRIGIGTSSPTDPLHIYSNSDSVTARVESISENANLIIHSAASKFSRTIYRQDDNRWETGMDDEATDKFYISHGTNFSDRYVTIQNDGNVGINATSPTAKLHIDGSVRFENLTIDNSLEEVIVRDSNGNLFVKEIGSASGSVAKVKGSTALSITTNTFVQLDNFNNSAEFIDTPITWDGTNQEFSFNDNYTFRVNLHVYCDGTSGDRPAPQIVVYKNGVQEGARSVGYVRDSTHVFSVIHNEMFQTNSTDTWSFYIRKITGGGGFDVVAAHTFVEIEIIK